MISKGKMPETASPAVALLRVEMDDTWEELQGILDGLTEEEFNWKPAKDSWHLKRVGERWTLDYADPAPDPPPVTTIAWRIGHLAACKVMYVEYAFRKGKLTWDDFDFPTTVSKMLLFLEESHGPLREALEGLTDGDLGEMRLTNWGELWPTEKIFWAMIHHDAHHGAQIATLRELYRVLVRGE